MANQLDGAAIRRTLLEVVAANADHLQLSTILQQSAQSLRQQFGRVPEQALLTAFYDLFRTGHMSWGLNLSNPSAPFCHLTEQGRRTLAQLSRDPANPDGYLSHLASKGVLSTIASAYIDESLRAYNADCLRAASVMVGGASERVILDLRDTMQGRLNALSRAVPQDLSDWRIKRVLDGLRQLLDSAKGSMPGRLREAFEAYWPAFVQIIRSARNDAGHPSDLSSVTPETVHASLLVFPEVAGLAKDLGEWIKASYQ